MQREHSVIAGGSDQSEPGAAKSDIDQLREDMNAVRESVSALASTTGRIAAGELKRQSKRASGLADTAAQKAGAYREFVSEKVKDHPFASIGAAVLVGLLISSMSRRHEHPDT